MPGNPHLAQALEATQHLTDDEPPWDALLGSTQRFMGGDSATFIVFDPAGSLIATRQHNVDAKAEQEYVQHFHAHDITTAHTRDAAQGTWFDTTRMRTIGMLPDERDYLDYMHRHRMRQMVGLIAIRAPDMHGGFTVQRSTVRTDVSDWVQRPEVRRFSAAVQAGLSALHRQRQDWVTHAQSTLECFAEALCILSPQGRVLHASPGARALLDGECGLRVRQGRLWHADEEGRRMLATGLQAATMHRQSCSLPLGPSPGRPWGHADFAPAPAWVGLGAQGPALLRLRPTLAHDATLLPRRLAAAFRLTMAEARVLAGLTMGESVTEHAQRHGSSPHTVRKQVATLMHKMGCTRQVELVRKALEFTP